MECGPVAAKAGSRRFLKENVLDSIMVCEGYGPVAAEAGLRRFLKENMLDFIMVWHRRSALRVITGAGGKPST